MCIDTLGAGGLASRRGESLWRPRARADELPSACTWTLYISLSIYIYIYMYIHVYSILYVYIYIYIYTNV